MKPKTYLKNDLYFQMMFDKQKINCENLIESTKQIFEYINQNYGLTLKYYEDYKDWNSLKVFEDDFKNYRQKIIESNFSKNFHKRKINCNTETVDNKKNNN